MPEAKLVPSALNMSKNKGGAYQDRDKPAQIRYSNISAAKGKAKRFLRYLSHNLTFRFSFMAVSGAAQGAVIHHH